ncbi:hypothetical protein IFR05_001460 [Cadophora sp. M221]|nr:hypothetical protein IFR05_001460 [Cadophora sp. M221]
MGWVYNSVNPDAATNSPTILGVGVFLTILSLSIVSLRLYVRARIVRTVTIDDWIIVATWFLAFIFVTITLAQTRWGLGLQVVADIPPQNVPQSGLLQYISAPFYILSLLGFKISAIFTFLRTAVDLTYRRVIVALAITCSIFHFSFFIAQLNLCNPVAKQWDPSITDGKCLPLVTFNSVMGSFVILFNILTMLTPTPILLHSCFSIRKNIVIGFAFLLGLIVTITQLMRILSIASQVKTNDHSQALIWSMVETNLGMVAVSILPLAPLFQSFLEKGSIRSLSLSSYDTRRSYDKLKCYLQKMRRENKTWNRLVMFLGYGEMHPDIESGSRRDAPTSRLGSRMGSRMGHFGGGSIEELTFPMGILKTTEVIISREGSEIGREVRGERILSFSKTVSILVGPDKQSFNVHQDLLALHSTFFRDHFTFAEQTIILPAVNAAEFAEFAAWIYNLGSLNLDNDRIEYDCDTTLDQDWALGSFLGAPKYQNKSLVLYGIYYNIHGRQWLNTNSIRIIYERRSPGSKLRKFAAHSIAAKSPFKEHKPGTPEFAELDALLKKYPEISIDIVHATAKD